MVQIMHISDVHLGKKFLGFGPFGQVLRQQLRQTFFQLLRSAPERVQLLLIAGDLFDSNEPDPSDVRLLLSTIRQIAPLPVCLLPGTHDRFSEDSVYRRREFRERPANFYLFDQDGAQVFFFPELATAVHGRANLTNRGGQPPLKGIRAHPDARFNVAVAHASVPLQQFAAEADDDYFVRLEEAAASGMDYIALGHWHRFGECFPELPVKVFYSGCPEPISFQGTEASGSWARVRLSENAATVTAEPTGRYRWLDFEVSANGHSDDAAVGKTLEAIASPDAVCRVRVTGRPALHYRLPVEAVEEEYAGRFAHLQITDQTAQDVPWEKLAGRFIPNSVGDFFCRLAQDQLQAASGESVRAHWREVLRRGAALLLGEEKVQ